MADLLERLHEPVAAQLLSRNTSSSAGARFRTEERHGEHHDGRARASHGNP